MRTGGTVIYRSTVPQDDTLSAINVIGGELVENFEDMSGADAVEVYLYEDVDKIEFLDPFGQWGSKNMKLNGITIFTDISNSSSLVGSSLFVPEGSILEITLTP